MASRNAARGSSKLASRIGKAELTRISKIGKLNGVSLVDYFPHGTPNPDGISGTFHVKPGALGTVIDQLLNGLKPNVQIFPKGIPKPDLFAVGFQLGSARRH